MLPPVIESVGAMEGGLDRRAGACSLPEEGHLGDPLGVLERHQVAAEACQCPSYRREPCCPVNVLSVTVY